jgi:beta-glucanase (GH16 family)
MKPPRQLHLILAIAFALGSAVTGIYLLTQSRAATTTSWQLAWSDEFNGSSLDASKWSVITGTDSTSQATYTTDSVTVGGGSLSLRTRRHCTNSNSTTLTESNYTTGDCPNGKTTRYSSGQIRTGNIFNQGRIEFRAKMPAAQPGLWPNVWMRNQSSLCTSGYGELDILEWYGDVPARATSTSHISCGGNATKDVAHTRNAGASLSSGWHTWAMNWSPSGISYEMDGVTIASATGDSNKSVDTATDFGLTSTAFNSVLAQLWQLRLGAQVVKSGTAGHAAPNPDANFPSAYLLIDYVRVYRQVVTNTTAKTPTPQPATPAAPVTSAAPVSGSPTPTSSATPVASEEDDEGTGTVVVKTPDTAKQPGTTTRILIDNVVIPDGKLDTTYLPNGEHILTVEVTKADGTKETTASELHVDNPLNPWQQVRNELYFPLKGNKAAMDGTMIAASAILFLTLAFIGFRIWKLANPKNIW